MKEDETKIFRKASQMTTHEKINQQSKINQLRAQVIKSVNIMRQKNWSLESKV